MNLLELQVLVVVSGMLENARGISLLDPSPSVLPLATTGRRIVEIEASTAPRANPARAQVLS